MKLKLWGTRGSLPRALNHQAVVNLFQDWLAAAEKDGRKTLAELRASLPGANPILPLVHGGNTTCTEVSHGQQHFMVDMGTGITDAAHAAVKAGRKEFIVFQTHLHWDHIMGLPFFFPIYMPDMKLIIYHVHKNAPEFIKIQFNGVNFPVKWEELGGKVEFRHIKLYETLRFGDITVSPFALDHPGGSFGYRFEAGGKSAAIGVDGEYKRVTPEDLGKDLPYYQNLDVFIFDAQYEMDELAHRFDWGHCSPPIGVDLALREGIRNLILTHHDPRSDDSKCRRMCEMARQHMQAQLPAYRDVWQGLKQPKGPNIRSAYDGLEIDCDSL